MFDQVYRKEYTILNFKWEKLDQHLFDVLYVNNIFLHKFGQT